MMGLKTKTIGALFFLIILIAACDSFQSLINNQQPDPVTVQLKWYHQAQFAGFYAARDQGFYEQENLEVSFLEGGPGIIVDTVVLNGEAQFGVTAAESIITARQDGKPIKAIAAIYRRNPQVFIALADSGISTPQDFAGQTIRVSPVAQVIFFTLMNRVGISPDEYTLSSELDYKLLYTGEVDVSSVFLTNEVLAAQAAGYEINIIYPDDYGIHGYGDTLFTTDALIDSDPALVTRFLRATMQGWLWAIENPDAAAVLSLEYNPALDAKHELAQLGASFPLIHTGQDYLGWMRAETWNEIIQTLVEQEVLTEPINTDEVYTMKFLQEIYEAEK